MVKTQIANTPIMFGSDGIIRYGENVENTFQERIIVDTTDNIKRFTNDQDNVQYIPPRSAIDKAGLQSYTTF